MYGRMRRNVTFLFEWIVPDGSKFCGLYSEILGVTCVIVATVP